MTRMTLASLFAGVGGACEGYRDAGFDVRCAVEIDPRAAEWHGRNFGGEVLPDVMAPDVVNRIRSACGGAAPDVLHASPPCQAFSTAGKRDMADPRAMLLHRVPRIVAKLKPRAVVIENVLGLTYSPALEAHFMPLLDAFHALGYRTDQRVLDASWFGVPQVRKRLFVIALRGDCDMDPADAFPRNGRWQTVMRDVLPDVAALVRVSGERFRAEHYRFRAGRTYPASRPAPTITCHAMDGHDASDIRVRARDGRLRRVTVDDLKALGGFPPDFELPERLDHAWKLVGNSVAPSVTRAIGEALAAALEGRVVAAA